MSKQQGRQKRQDKQRQLRELPDLSRTAMAIEEYDKYHDKFKVMPTDRNLGKAVGKLERLAEAVGGAFGLDTIDRNDPQTCKDHIRPGFANPPPGYELSFVRRMIKKWKEQKE